MDHVNAARADAAAGAGWRAVVAQLTAAIRAAAAEPDAAGARLAGELDRALGALDAVSWRDAGFLKAWNLLRMVWGFGPCAPFASGRQGPVRTVLHSLG